LRDPISKNPSQKRAGGMVQGVGPEFESQYHKKKKPRIGPHKISDDINGNILKSKNNLKSETPLAPIF
jgi:hypothetical protein